MIEPDSGPPSIEEAYYIADAVFTATVLAVRYGCTPSYLVDAVYKGTLQPGQSIPLQLLHKAHRHSTWLWDFTVGHQYLIYANHLDNSYGVNRSGRTKPLAEASAELAALPAFLQDSSQATRVYGVVYEWIPGESPGESDVSPLAGAQVRILQAGQIMFETSTQSDGTFNLPVVAPGHYQAKAQGLAGQVSTPTQFKKHPGACQKLHLHAIRPRPNSPPPPSAAHSPREP